MKSEYQRMLDREQEAIASIDGPKMSEQKPREFWIAHEPADEYDIEINIVETSNNKDKSIHSVDSVTESYCWCHTCVPRTHVIEHSSFLAVSKERDELNAKVRSLESVITQNNAASVKFSPKDNNEPYIRALQAKIAELENENDRLSKLFAKNVLGICDNMEDLYKGQIQSLTEHNKILLGALEKAEKQLRAHCHCADLIDYDDGTYTTCDFCKEAQHIVEALAKVRNDLP